MSPGVEGELPYACGGGFEGLLANVMRQCKLRRRIPHPIIQCLRWSWICAPLWLAFPLGRRILSLFIWVAGHWRCVSGSFDFLTVLLSDEFLPVSCYRGAN